MIIGNDKFYKSQGFLWIVRGTTIVVFARHVEGPYCTKCFNDLDFPDEAYDIYIDQDGEPHSVYKDKWVGKLNCSNCGKEFVLSNPIDKIKELVVKDYVLKIRAQIPVESLDELPTKVNVKDEDEKYFISAKIGVDKQGKRLGVVYFGEKKKDQNKKDYSQVFVDFDKESVRSDATNKNPKDLLAEMQIEFRDTVVKTDFSKHKKKVK